MTIIAKDNLHKVRTELEAGMALPKCRQCGCMDGALKNLVASIPADGTADSSALSNYVLDSIQKMRPIRYDCLGCDYCYPAEAQNAFASAYPDLYEVGVDLACDFRAGDDGWPPVAGEYFVLDRDNPVAVSTLASLQLAEELAHVAPDGLAIIGKTETENIGIDKVVKNLVANPTIRYLIVAGSEARGHLAGETILALAANGIDDSGRVIGSTGKRPVLRNVSLAEVHAFREQVQVEDMIGCEDPDDIGRRIEALASSIREPCGCSSCGGEPPVSISTTPKMTAAEPDQVVKLDQAGYFVILPLKERGVINVEQYAYDNSLLRVIEGVTARAIYRTIIDNGWVTELSHAAYLGKELAKAELSLQLGFQYVQDGA